MISFLKTLVLFAVSAPLVYSGSVYAQSCPSFFRTNWQWVDGNTSPTDVYGNYDSNAGPLYPGGRNLGVTWTGTDGLKWMFGGVGEGESGEFGVMNELWNYNQNSNEWNYVAGSGTRNQPGDYDDSDGIVYPGSRSHAVTWTALDGSLWLFGGNGFGSIGSENSHNDLWKFNPSTSKWEFISGSTATGAYGDYDNSDGSVYPGCRSGAVSWTDANGNFWLFGGGGRAKASTVTSGRLNDLWKYNPVENKWFFVNGSDGINLHGDYDNSDGLVYPGARYASVSFTGSDGSLWLFAGSGYPANGDIVILDDLWKYEPVTNKWKFVSGNSAGGGLVTMMTAMVQSVQVPESIVLPVQVEMGNSGYLEVMAMGLRHLGK